MSLVTVYFMVLPFLLAKSIYYAKQKQFQKHIKTQIALYVFTLIIVLYFEVMIRISGGFLYYKEHAVMDELFMLVYLIIHIIIAILAIILWSYTLFSTHNAYKHNVMNKTRHKMLGISTFILLTTSCIMGTGMYYMLFLYT